MKNKLLQLFIILGLCNPSILFAAEDKLIFAIDLIRHGDRTPEVMMPKVDYQWKLGKGQLTPLGMRQEYNLGSKLRHRYVEETHLLPQNYQPGTLYARSTSVERTLMSAQAFLMGLYPPGTGPSMPNSKDPALPHASQPIPIFTSPFKYDDVISKNLPREEYERIMNDIHSTPQWKNKNDELKSQYARFSTLTGVNIKGLESLRMLGDTLYIHQLYHAPMPQNMSDEDINSIIEASKFVFITEAESKVATIALYQQLMTTIAKYLEEGSRQSSDLKYVLLSAHDVTIAGALSYMDISLNGTLPPYASDLNFSLYENGFNHYIVKVTYNDAPISIPACGKAQCELDQFLQILRK